MIPLRNPINLPILSRTTIDIDLGRLGVLNSVATLKTGAHTCLKDLEETTTDLERCANGDCVGFTLGNCVGTSAGEARTNFLAEAGSFYCAAQDFEAVGL